MAKYTITIVLYLCLCSLFGQDLLQGDTVYTEVDEPPEWQTDCQSVGEDYRNCWLKAMSTYLRRHIKFPSLAVVEGIEGTVIADFVIEQDGRVSNILITEDPGYGMGKAVSIAIKRMNLYGPAWKPGKLNGTPVRVRYELQIPFLF